MISSKSSSVFKFTSFNSSKKIILRQYMFYRTVINVILWDHISHAFSMHQVIIDDLNANACINKRTFIAPLCLVPKNILAVAGYHFFVSFSFWSRCFRLTRLSNIFRVIKLDLVTLNRLWVIALLCKHPLVDLVLPFSIQMLLTNLTRISLITLLLFGVFSRQSGMSHVS